MANIGAGGSGRDGTAGRATAGGKARPQTAASGGRAAEDPDDGLPDGGARDTADIQAVQRVGQILALFGPQTAQLSAADVADRLGLNRTTAYRYCVSLVTAGILDRGTRRGTFVLGGLMLQLGIHALGRRRVVRIAPPYLAKLAHATRATSLLAVWGARGPVVALVEEDISRGVVVTTHPGTQLDHTAAQMRVFLAHDPHRDALDRVAQDLSPAARAELEAGVYLVRRTGYSIVSHTGSLFGAAAPVFDEYGICATVALLGADHSADLSPGSAILTALLQTAGALTEALGGDPEGTVLAHD
jgi:DNA-binding IclR family transcriptional regulator